MNMRRALVLGAAVLMAACGQQQQDQKTDGADSAVIAETQDGVSDGEEGDFENLPDVDPALLAAPNEAFTAIEPSEVGVFGAPTVDEALAPLLGPEGAEGASLYFTMRESGDSTVADIVRAGLADDSVSAGHVRIEFRREPDGWYPTNAYRRAQCVRGALAGQWTSELCP